MSNWLRLSRCSGATAKLLAPGLFGSGISADIFAERGSIWLVGIILPGNWVRMNPAPFGFGAKDAGSKIGLNPAAEKFPILIASVGMVVTSVVPWFSRVPSQLPKKKVLF